jgi:hypothetical protein
MHGSERVPGVPGARPWLTTLVFLIDREARKAQLFGIKIRFVYNGLLATLTFLLYVSL